MTTYFVRQPGANAVRGKPCAECGLVKALDAFSPDATGYLGRRIDCHVCAAAGRRARRQEDPAVREKERADCRQRHQGARTQVFDVYGWTCSCCGRGEPEVQLSIDHIFGDGSAHRLELFGDSNMNGGRMFYQWVIDNGFPDFLQSLCRPCNASKRDGDQCQLDHDRVKELAR
jgi:hypothetical protein